MFLCGMAFLIDNQLDIAEIVTDASSSVRKSLGTVKLYSAYVTGITCICVSVETKYPAVHHSLDVWHKSKKLKKAL